MLWSEECSNFIKIWEKNDKKYLQIDPTLYKACEGKQTIFWPKYVLWPFNMWLNMYPVL